MSLKSNPLPFVTATLHIIIVVTVDASTVPEFGGWACYDCHAHRWQSPDRIKSLVASWFERHGSDYSGKTPA
jgi:hypothetical protein